MREDLSCCLARWHCGYEVYVLIRLMSYTKIDIRKCTNTAGVFVIMATYHVALNPFAGLTLLPRRRSRVSNKRGFDLCA